MRRALAALYTNYLYPLEVWGTRLLFDAVKKYYPVLIRVERCYSCPFAHLDDSGDTLVCEMEVTPEQDRKPIPAECPLRVRPVVVEVAPGL